MSVEKTETSDLPEKVCKSRNLTALSTNSHIKLCPYHRPDRRGGTIENGGGWIFEQKSEVTETS